MRAVFRAWRADIGWLLTLVHGPTALTSHICVSRPAGGKIVSYINNCSPPPPPTHVVHCPAVEKLFLNSSSNNISSCTRRPLLPTHERHDPPGGKLFLTEGTAPDATTSHTCAARPASGKTVSRGGVSVVEGAVVKLHLSRGDV